jgi:transcriptional regulator
MHPNALFHRDDPDALLGFAAAIGFAHIFVGTPAEPMVVHAPVTREGGVLSFHVAQANRITPHLDGARVLISVSGAQGYVSPIWYADRHNQVPTWNYVAVELEGVARRIDDAALAAQLEALAGYWEPRVNPAQPWTSDKVEEALLAGMRQGIVGFAVTIDRARGTTKLNQNKSEADRAGVIAGLVACGNHHLAEAMR